MLGAIRRSPPVCILVSLWRLLIGNLRLFPTDGQSTIIGSDGKPFLAFRHIRLRSRFPEDNACPFAVTFKFRSLSHNANRIASVIPMLAIAGFPGFLEKVYAVEPESGYWMGLYRWRSREDLKRYQDSLVFKTMNRRAIPESIDARLVTLPVAESGAASIAFPLRLA